MVASVENLIGFGIVNVPSLELSSGKQARSKITGLTNSERPKEYTEE
jgi:hypothetical protein